MVEKKLIDTEEMLQEIQEQDPERYKEIMENVQQRTEEFYKHGGKRPGAGRKKIYNKRVKATFDLEEADVIQLKEYAKEHKMSKNQVIKNALNNLIQEG